MKRHATVSISRVGIGSALQQVADALSVTRKCAFVKRGWTAQLFLLGRLGVVQQKLLDLWVSFLLSQSP